MWWSHDKNITTTTTTTCRFYWIVEPESEAPMVVTFRLWVWYWPNQNSKEGLESYSNVPMVWEDITAAGMKFHTMCPAHQLLFPSFQNCKPMVVTCRINSSTAITQNFSFTTGTIQKQQCKNDNHKQFLLQKLQTAKSVNGMYFCRSGPSDARIWHLVAFIIQQPNWWSSTTGLNVAISASTARDIVSLTSPNNNV